MEDNTVFSVFEVAKYLHVSPDTVRRRIREKKIPFYKVGINPLFRKSVIDRWIEEQEQENCRKGVI